MQNRLPIPDVPERSGPSPRRAGLLCCALAALAVPGCALFGGPPQPPGNSAEEPQPPAAEKPYVPSSLEQAAERASRASVAVAEIEVAAAGPVGPGPGQQLPDGISVPEELKAEARMDWQGKAESAVAQLAAKAGYGFSVSGDPPPNAVRVNVVTEAPVIDILRQIGSAVHAYADIYVDFGKRMVRMEYR